MKNKFQKKINSCKVCGEEYLQTSYNLTRCETCKTQKLKKCKTHNDAILGPHKSCPKCSLEKSLIKYTEQNEDDWIECPLCGYRAGDLGPHIIKHHKMSTEEFRTVTGLVSIKSKNQRERVKGENNPGYKHGGKFSPFSEKFIYANNNNIEEIVAKVTKTRKENNNNTTSIEYWLKKTDGNLKEAQKLFSERQSTFSLDKCIDKLGNEKGLERWVERQELWQFNLSNKPKEEIEKINSKKSTRINYRKLWNSELDCPGHFYILELSNGFLKIGVTTSGSLNKRYKRKHRTTYKVIEFYNSNINHCFHIEQLLKKKFSKNSINKSEEIEGFGWTETFKNLNVDILIEEFNFLLDEENTKKLFEKTFKRRSEEHTSELQSH